MSTTSHHFRLGAFILAGVGLLAATIIYLGVGELFKDTLTVETYIDESVQGLDVGGAVKFRGVKVGTVEDISFVWARYDNAEELGRYVLVDMALDRDLATSFFGQKASRETLFLRKPVESGLRARLTTQGLTGVAFVELDFFPPQQNPPLPITWEPTHPYIPSAPSTMSRLEAALGSIGQGLKEFESIDFRRMGNSLAEILDKVNAGLDEEDVATIGELVRENLVELRDGFRRVNVLLADKRLDALIPDAAATLAGARRMVQSSEENFVATFQQARNVTANLEHASAGINSLFSNPKLEQSVENVPQVLDDIRAATRDIRRSTVQLERTLRTVSDLTDSESATIRAILQDARKVMDNLSAITGDARQNPSRLILGAPPKRITPETMP
ncbi:paraquat-inducible protein B [Desulfobaculum xiamenense]|uniref:Paraquat-inducible protein B n=1 Tax=Desulfobaculum xiamenense TaxID=995050 RepID=A0A846QN83_9BACT|nr:MlaD family protein [Desulfobaculum xiamenense]NJB67723.1 paraquat-inducible protein B [Desulfobaculum xiamenense]